jgi:uncharacterized lipoprotein YddW (UPF0748 family)
MLQKPYGRRAVSGMICAVLASTLLLAQASAGTVTVVAADGTPVAVTAQNAARVAGATILYSLAWGYTTGTNSYGTEVILARTQEDAQRFTVTGVNGISINAAASGNSSIPLNGFVLSGAPGSPAQLLTDHFHAGDSVVVQEQTKQTATLTATAVNQTRGTNELIIYTPDFGASTGTNAYGYEATVENGIITKAGGNNSPIPSDGFVLSGHGTAADWLSSHAVIGSQAALNGLDVTITTDAASYVYQASQAIDYAKSSVQDGLARFINARFDKAQELIPQAAKYLANAAALETANPSQSIFLAQGALSTAQSAYYYTLPSRVAEARGTWYRPVETSMQQVQQTLDHMQAGGFNELYLETWFQGYTIYPSAVAAAYNLPSQNPAFTAFDPLGVFATEGKKRGIAVHAWVDGFMVGTGSGGGPVLKAHPDWTARTRDQAAAGAPTPDPSTGYYWIDIANPQVRQFLLELTEEMVRQYGLAGIDWDYTRFPAESNWQRSFDFSAYARNAYQTISGTDPYTLNADTQPAAWSAWTGWLSDQEDQFIQDAYGAMKRIGSGVVVSATPEPGAESQQIGKWSHYVDVVIPQAYSLGSVPPLVQQMESQLAPGNLVYAGIYPFYHRESADMTVAEVLSGRELVSGTNIFAFGEANPLDISALQQGVWREPAISTGLHPVNATRAQLVSIIDDLLTVYLPRGATNAKTAAHLLRRMGRINTLLSDPVNSNAAKQKIAALRDYVSREASASRINTIVSGRLDGELQYLDELLTYSLIKNVQ